MWWWRPVQLRGNWYGPIRDLSAAGAVAVVVALASTLAGSVLDRVHQVDAEGIQARETKATVTGEGTQRLAIAEWGVQIELPLAQELPLVSYAAQSTASVGLSAADLEQLGPACRASRNALGSVLRVATGTYAQMPRGATIDYFVATVDGYDYVYQLPQGTCADLAGAQGVINREVSVIREAMQTLAPLGAH